MSVNMLIGLLVLGPIAVTIVWSVVRLVIAAGVYAFRHDDIEEAE